MKTVKLLIISSLFFLLFSCKENNRKQEAKSTNSQKEVLTSELNQTKDKLQYVEKSGLEGKKFYFLKKDENNQLILEIFPQYSGDFEMKKYIFKDKTIIDGGNVMEPSKWNIKAILKKDSIIKYIIKMNENNKIIDTLNLIYNQNKGLLYHKVRKGYNPIILIDSSNMKNIKTVKMRYENDDE